MLTKRRTVTHSIGPRRNTTLPESRVVRPGHSIAARLRIQRSQAIEGRSSQKIQTKDIDERHRRSCWDYTPILFTFRKRNPGRIAAFWESTYWKARHVLTATNKSMRAMSRRGHSCPTRPDSSGRSAIPSTPATCTAALQSRSWAARNPAAHSGQRAGRLARRHRELVRSLLGNTLNGSIGAVTGTAILTNAANVGGVSLGNGALKHWGMFASIALRRRNSNSTAWLSSKGSGPG
jgi:hypothetical protein